MFPGTLWVPGNGHFGAASCSDSAVPDTAESTGPREGVKVTLLVVKSDSFAEI